MSGFVPQELTVNQLTSEWSAILQAPQPVLAVMDYAETRREHLVALLKLSLHFKAANKVRIVLLARRGDDWWDQLGRDRNVGDLIRSSATTRHYLSPLAQTHSERKASYEQAAKVFAEVLNKPAPKVARKDLTAVHYERVLLLHMMALASVEDVQVEGPNGILDYVLARERRYWAEQLQRRELSSTLEAGVGQAMAAVTLAGGVETESNGLQLLRAVPFFSGQSEAVLTSVNRLLHDCYPGKRWIEPVMPDLLGERLFEIALEDEATRESFFSLFSSAPQ